MHLGELVGEDYVDCSLVVDIVRKVYVDLVGVCVGVLGRVHTRKVLIFEKYRAVRRGQRGEVEGALQVLAGRGMVEVD